MTRANTTRWYSPVGVMIGDGAMCLQTVTFRLSQRIGGLGTSSESPLLVLSGMLLWTIKGRGPMTKLIPDQMEMTLEYPDELYVGHSKVSRRLPQWQLPSIFSQERDSDITVSPNDPVLGNDLSYHYEPRVNVRFCHFSGH
jgi:hypothetical protein